VNEKFREYGAMRDIMIEVNLVATISYVFL